MIGLAMTRTKSVWQPLGQGGRDAVTPAACVCCRYMPALPGVLPTSQEGSRSKALVGCKGYVQKALRELRGRSHLFAREQ